MAQKQQSFVRVDSPQQTPSVRELPQKERPINRLRDVGPKALSTIELLACILQTSDAIYQASLLLTMFESLYGVANATEEELTTVEGIGPAIAARLIAACEIGHRFIADQVDNRLLIRSPSDAAAMLLAPMGALERENFVVVFLDTRHRVLTHRTLYEGTINTSVVRIAEVFQEAIRRNSESVIIAHNHPSGDPSPSPEDIVLTRRLVEAGKLLEVEVLDHLIIGRQRWVSMKELGRGFESV